MSDKQPILTPKQRQQRNRDEMTAAILQAAREVMREQGVADLNLQEIARRVGMRAPSLYNYFPNRTAIYDALFILGARMYSERWEALFAQYGATWEGLQRMMEGYLTFALENPELYQLLFERPVPGFVPSADGLRAAGRLMDMSHRMTEAISAAGMMNASVPPEVGMNLFIALMHGFTALHLANEPHLPLGEGRFGSLVPTIIELLRSAWGRDSQSQ